MSSVNVKPTMPADVLELRAAEQRRRLHNTVVDLREKARETLDVKKTARDHLASAAGAAGAIGLFLGYITAVMVGG